MLRKTRDYAGMALLLLLAAGPIAEFLRVPQIGGSRQFPVIPFGAAHFSLRGRAFLRQRTRLPRRSDRYLAVV
jgi:hypothetical protein